MKRKIFGTIVLMITALFYTEVSAQQVVQSGSYEVQMSIPASTNIQKPMFASTDAVAFTKAFPNVDPQVKNKGLIIASAVIEAPNIVTIFRSVKVYVSLGDGSNEVLIASSPGSVTSGGKAINLNLAKRISADKSTQAQRVDAGQSIESMLSRQPGVNVSGGEIQVRGANGPPLFIIDGAEKRDLQGIQGSDILTITVLKDAAETGIYGVRGSNGVIVIKTNASSGGRGNSLDLLEKSSEIMVRLEYVLRNRLAAETPVTVRIGFK